jgi:hypothetical protein
MGVWNLFLSFVFIQVFVTCVCHFCDTGVGRLFLSFVLVTCVCYMCLSRVFVMCVCHVCLSLVLSRASVPRATCLIWQTEESGRQI